MDYLAAQGWLTEAERRLLHGLAAQTPSRGIILNVGVEYGASVVCLRAGNPHALLYALDIDITKATEDARAAASLLLEYDSGKAAENWVLPLDLAFIDGDHSSTGVTRDTLFCNHIAPGGVVAFHDCYRWNAPARTIHAICPEVNQAVSDWYAAHRDEWQEREPVDSIRVFERVK